MKRQVIIPIERGMISILIIMILSFDVRSQNWIPVFEVKIDYRPIHMIGKSLGDFLQYGHPYVAKGCDTKVCIFHFRVNSKGDVDSLYFEGNFDKIETDVILGNILKTSGNWILPSNTTKDSFCWFVYPCYILGELVYPCLNDPQNQQQIVLLRNLLTNYSNTFDKRGRYLLAPNEYGYYSKQ